MICSPGQQQLMALIRAVLNKPDILFLDEATSALDDISQMNAYQNLHLLLPQTCIMSITHRSDLEQFHHKCLFLTRNGKLTQMFTNQSFPSNTPITHGNENQR